MIDDVIASGQGQKGARRVLGRGMQQLFLYFLFLYTEVIPAVVRMDDGSVDGF